MHIFSPFSSSKLFTNGYFHLAICRKSVVKFKIYRALSPIVVANPHNKKDSTKYYYNLEDYHKDEKNLKNYEIIYTKGLGGLSDHDYKQMLRNQKLIKFDLKDIEDMETINIWFDKSTEMRKQILLEDSTGDLD